MKSLIKISLAALLGLLAALGSVQVAQAYPEFVMEVDLSKRVVVEGKDFRAEASANANCSWTIRFDDATRRGQGPAISTTFTAPDVDERTTMPVRFTCAYDSTATTERAGVIDSRETRTLEITVVPRGSGASAPSDGPDAAGSDLPSTGGPNLLFLVVGLLLLLLGAAAVKYARNRDEDVEVEPGQA